MLRSIGLRSDLLVMTGVSTLTPCPLGHIMRTLSEPTYWRGNSLIRDTSKVQPDIDIAAFQATFPDATHVKILWDIPDLDVRMMSGVFPDNFEIDTFDVLTGRGAATSNMSDGIAVRPLRSDVDWVASETLAAQIVVEEGYDPAVHRPFLRRRIITRRAQIADGLGDWFGAFDGDQLVAQMGMFYDATIARFLSVETCASHRRRGICAALLGEVSAWAKGRAPNAKQVIIAQADSDAGRLYRRAGFALTETLVEVTKRGY